MQYQKQNQFWNELVQLKVDICYLNLICRDADNFDFWVKMTLATTSCLSLGFWTQFSEYGFVWGLIIAISQVGSAIQHLLPYERRRNVILNADRDFTELFLDSQKHLENMHDSKISESGIGKKLNDLRAKKADLGNWHFKSIILPEIEKFHKIASRVADDFFRLHYPHKFNN